MNGQIDRNRMQQMRAEWEVEDAQARREETIRKLWWLLALALMLVTLLATCWLLATWG